MQFLVPHQRIKFEIPEAWLNEAKINGFTPSALTYVASPDPKWPTVAVPLREVAAPVRDPGVRGLNKERTIAILQAIVLRQALPPIAADEPPDCQLFRYRVLDGYHRFYVSVALEFSHLPIAIEPHFEFGAR